MEEQFTEHPVIRKEGREKVTGRARYVDDLAFPEMLHGVTVRSSVARGRIRGIRFGEGIPWSEFTVVTAADISGKNEIALIEHDQLCLAAEFINHPEEAIVLLAHPDRYLLEETRRAVQIDVEPLPAIFSIEDSIAKRAVIFEVDTSHFKGNFPESCSLEVCTAPRDLIDPSALGALPWKEILAKTKLQADSRHVYEKELLDAGEITHARFHIYPDGGVARLRIFGTLAKTAS